MSIQANQKIIIRDSDDSKNLYPRAVTTNIINEDEELINVQEQIVATEGVKLDSDNKTIRSNITINGDGPEWRADTQSYDFNLDYKNRTVTDVPAPNSTDLITSGGVYNYLTSQTIFYTQVLEEGEIPSSHQTSSCLQVINNLLRTLQNNDDITYDRMIRFYIEVFELSNTPTEIIDCFEYTWYRYGQGVFDFTFLNVVIPDVNGGTPTRQDIDTFISSNYLHNPDIDLNFCIEVLSVPTYKVLR